MTGDVSVAGVRHAFIQLTRAFGMCRNNFMQYLSVVNTFLKPLLTSKGTGTYIR